MVYITNICCYVKRLCFSWVSLQFDSKYGQMTMIVNLITIIFDHNDTWVL